MSDEAPINLRPVADFFGLVGTAPVEKDLHVVRAIRAVTSIDASPFTLVFGGGTALARAHKIIQRMSEDVDFKIVPTPASPVTRAGLRNQLSDLRNRVTEALQAAGFAFDTAAIRSQNANHYTVYQLPYPESGAGQGLRPTIQIEMTYAPLRLAPVELPVSSFVAEAYRRSPEITALPCVSVTETAAEKLVALTRRTAMDLAGLSRDPDPTLVRHIYDLHMIRNLIDPGQVAQLAHAIAKADAEEFRNQYPAYADDIAGETRKALTALQKDSAYRSRYRDFVAAMAYGERPEFDTAFGSVVALAERMKTTT